MSCVKREIDRYRERERERKKEREGMILKLTHGNVLDYIQRHSV
jgi:hypothetical protein